MKTIGSALLLTVLWGCDGEREYVGRTVFYFCGRATTTQDLLAWRELDPTARSSEVMNELRSLPQDEFPRSMAGGHSTDEASDGGWTGDGVYDGSSGSHYRIKQTGRISGDSVLFIPADRCILRFPDSTRGEGKP